MSEQGKSIKAKLLVIFVALLILPVPTSSQTDNCCFVDRQCDTDEQWISGYWAFQNNQCAAPSPQQQSPSSQSQPQPAASEDTDNCCFVDRQCMTNEEWVNGYNAYQNNQCAAPSQQQQQSTTSQSQPRGSASDEVNNCCFTGWQCDADADWKSGYFAFQHNQCASQSQWPELWRQLQQPQQQNVRQQQSTGSQYPIKTTHNIYTGEYTFEYEDGDVITARPATQKEICDALKDAGMPLPPECDDN